MPGERRKKTIKNAGAEAGAGRGDVRTASADGPLHFFEIF
jgi:hypothetical protein